MNAKTAYALTHRQDWLAQPVLQMMNVALFFVGAGFWIGAQTDSLVFDVHTYGEFALRFPAEMWAALMMTGSALSIVGLIRPVHRRKVALGSAIQSAQFTALAYSAILTGGGEVVGLFASFVFAPIFLLTAVRAMQNGSQ